MLDKMKTAGVSDFRWKSGFFWMVLGTLMAVLSGPDSAVGALTLGSSIGQKFLESFGLSLILFGLFTIILQTRDWKLYFERHLSDIIVQDSYLAKLNGDQLADLQKRILVRQLGSGEFDPERSFLGYFHTELHKLISEPYREEVEDEVLCRELENGDLEVVDNISYICRQVGERMQDRIFWSLDPGEVKDFRRLRIRAKLPLGHEDDHGSETILDCEAGEIPRAEGGGYLIDMPIPENCRVDGVRISVESVYSIETDWFQYWSMAYPTRNFCFILRYPPNYRIQTWAFVQSENRLDKTEEEGYRKIRYDSWMLPNNGVVWQFQKTNGIHEADSTGALKASVRQA